MRESQRTTLDSAIATLAGAGTAAIACARRRSAPMPVDASSRRALMATLTALRRACVVVWVVDARPRSTPSSSISPLMHWIDWTIDRVSTWSGWSGTACGSRRAATRLEGYFLGGRSLPWWAGRPVGDGDAAVRDHDDRHDRPGLRRRHALPAVLLRAAARDGHPVA